MNSYALVEDSILFDNVEIGRHAKVRKASMTARATVQSFDWRTLAVVQAEAPEIVTVYLSQARGAGDTVELVEDRVRTRLCDRPRRQCRHPWRLVRVALLLGDTAVRQQAGSGFFRGVPYQ